MRISPCNKLTHLQAFCPAATQMLACFEHVWHLSTRSGWRGSHTPRALRVPVSHRSL